MADEKYTKLPAPPISNGDSNHNITGVVKIAGDSQLPREFITTGHDIDSALALSTLIDNNEQNDLTRLYSKSMRWGVQRALDDMRFWLNARRTVGGYQLLHALMGHTGIISPEASGVRMSKQGAETLRKANLDKVNQRKAEANDQHPA